MRIRCSQRSPVTHHPVKQRSLPEKGGSFFRLAQSFAKMMQSQSLPGILGPWLCRVVEGYSHVNI